MAKNDKEQQAIKSIRDMDGGVELTPGAHVGGTPHGLKAGEAVTIERDANDEDGDVTLVFEGKPFQFKPGDSHTFIASADNGTYDTASISGGTFGLAVAKASKAEKAEAEKP